MNPLAMIGGPYALLIKWVIIISLVLGFGGVCAYKMHEHDQIELDQVKADFNAFKGGVAALGKAAADRARLADTINQQNKEASDADHKTELAALQRTITGLRGERAKRGTSGGFVPEAPRPTGSPALVTSERPLLDGALRTLDTEVQGLVDEGSKAVVDLNAGKKWALKMATTMGQP